MTLVLDHIVLNVLDVRKMLMFYTDILDLSGERVTEYEKGTVPFPSVRLSAETIIDLFPKHLWGKSSPDQICRPNLNHFCLVADKSTWQHLHARLDERGIAIDDGPVKRWGARGSGVSIYFRDPEENVIELRYYELDDLDQPCLL
ncbi:MAG: extradiol dioxygenase, partial [Desulfuromonas sp.]